MRPKHRSLWALLIVLIALATILYLIASVRMLEVEWNPFELIP